MPDQMIKTFKKQKSRKTQKISNVNKQISKANIKLSKRNKLFKKWLMDGSNIKTKTSKTTISTTPAPEYITENPKKKFLNDDFSNHWLTCITNMPLKAVWVKGSACELAYCKLNLAEKGL